MEARSRPVASANSNRELATATAVPAKMAPQETAEAPLAATTSAAEVCISFMMVPAISDANTAPEGE